MSDNTPKKLILASSSNGRRMVLEQAGVNFTKEPSEYDEDMTLPMSREELVQYLASGKARDVAHKHKGEPVVIIGADSIVFLDEQRLGKPHTPERAMEMLRMLRGKTNQIYTGVCVIDAASGREAMGYQASSIFMRDYSDEEAAAYVATGQPLNKAGAYAIQDKGSLLIEKIEGEYTNIIGLPLPLVQQLIKPFGATLW